MEEYTGFGQSHWFSSLKSTLKVCTSAQIVQAKMQKCLENVLFNRCCAQCVCVLTGDDDCAQAIYVAAFVV